MWIEWKSAMNEWIPNYYNDSDLSPFNLVWVIQFTLKSYINHRKYHSEIFHCICVHDDIVPYFLNCFSVTSIVMTGLPFSWFQTYVKQRLIQCDIKVFCTKVRTLKHEPRICALNGQFTYLSGTLEWSTKVFSKA